MEAKIDPLWKIFQLADSTFPTGGFAHSGGLEAALQHGEIKTADEFENFLSQALWQIGHGGLPLVNAAYQAPEKLSEWDQTNDVFLSNHVSNRGSRIQGRTFFSTCRRTFPNSLFDEIAKVAELESFYSHYAPLFGAIFRALEVDREMTQRLHLQFALRTVVSAAVRLGIVGPYEAQRIQHKFAEVLTKVLESCGKLQVSDLAQTSPLIDLFQSNHDRLYSRLFQT